EAPQLGTETAAGDVADATIRLHRIVLAVEIVHGEQFPGCGLRYPRIAHVPAAAIVAEDGFPPPGAAIILAEADPDAEWGHAVAVDAGDAAIAHSHQVAG